MFHVNTLKAELKLQLGLKRDAVCWKTEKESGFAKENERESEGSEKWISSSRKGCWGHVSSYAKAGLTGEWKRLQRLDCCILNLWVLDCSFYKPTFYKLGVNDKSHWDASEIRSQRLQKGQCALYPNMQHVHVGEMGMGMGLAGGGAYSNYPVHPAAASIHSYL